MTITQYAESFNNEVHSSKSKKRYWKKHSIVTRLTGRYCLHKGSAANSKSTLIEPLYTIHVGWGRIRLACNWQVMWKESQPTMDTNIFSKHNRSKIAFIFCLYSCLKQILSDVCEFWYFCCKKCFFSFGAMWCVESSCQNEWKKGEREMVLWSWELLSYIS